MSKASEYYNRLADLKRPRLYNDQRGLLAEVSDAGGLTLVKPNMEAKEAVSLSRWILDTFGEQP